MPAKVLGRPAGKKTTTGGKKKTADSWAKTKKKKTASSQAKVKLTLADRRHWDMSAAVLKLQQELEIYKGVSKFQQEQLFQFRRELENERRARKHGLLP